MIKKSVYLGVILSLIGTISCEKNLEDLETSVIKNSVFSTKDTIIEIDIYPDNVESVRADNIETNSIKHLLGVYNNPYHKKIEASFISQLKYKKYELVKEKYEKDITVETKIDAAFIKLPYPVTENNKKFTIDSILGNRFVETKIKVYLNNTYLNKLNPLNPKKNNQYQSNYESYMNKKGVLLNQKEDFGFIPLESDTTFIVKRYDGLNKYIDETVKDNPVKPSLKIPLNKDEIKSRFLDLYDKKEFSNEQSFKNHYRGFIIEASGDNGCLIPFDFTKGTPTLEIYYTNVFIKNGKEIKTIRKNNSFVLGDIRNSFYKMSESSATQVSSNEFAIQGTAGKIGKINLFSDAQLKSLKSKKWLITDASISFYVNNNKSTKANIVPQRLLLYRKAKKNNIHLQDSYASSYFGGTIKINESKKPEQYDFKITNYISDLLNNKTGHDPLILKVYNDPTDSPVVNKSANPIVGEYNWNPRGVVLYNNKKENTTKRARLKISYSVKN